MPSSTVRVRRLEPPLAAAPAGDFGADASGARYVETVRLPKDHEMYAQGARYRRRYRVDLGTKRDNP